MSMTFAQIVSAVYGEVGVGYSNPLETIALANRAVSELLECGFSQLRAVGTINMTSATNYALPAKFHRYIEDSAYVVGNIKAVSWPTTPEDWARLQASSLSGGPVLYVRQAASLTLDVLNPMSGRQLKFEYSTNDAISDGAVTPAYKRRFTAGTDVWLLDDDLLILEYKWRLRQFIGRPEWERDKKEAEDYRDLVLTRDNGAKTIRAEGEPSDGSPYTNLTV